MSEPNPLPPESNPPTAGGLWVMFALVVGGLAGGAGLYRYNQPRAAAALRADLEAAPNSLSGRLDLWHTYTAPQLHGLVAATRISAQQPWLVTHQVRPPGNFNSPARIYGFDVDLLPPIISRIEGETVRIDVPRPAFLAETVLVGDNARDVPSFQDELSERDVIGRLHTILGHLYRPVAKALAKEEQIGVAKIEIWIEGESAPYVVGPEESGFVGAEKD